MTAQPQPRPADVAPPSAHAAPVRKFADLLPRDRPEPSGRGHGVQTAPGAPDRAPRVPSVDAEEELHVARIAGLVGRAAFESMAGMRPVQQLARWLDHENFEKLRRRIELTGEAPGARAGGIYRSPSIRRCRVCRVDAGVYEVALVVADRSRVRAAALRVMQQRGQWRVSALEIG